VTPGQRLRRLSDGVEGVVREVAIPGGPAFATEYRIMYEDRGELLMAPKREQWIPVEEPRAPLHEDEIREVALRADQALRAVDRHEVYRYWERPLEQAHDPELVRVISEYLRARS